MKRRFKAFQVFKTGCLVIGLAAFLALLMLVASGQGNHYLNGAP